MEKHINAPFTEEQTKELKSGDYVYISGTIYTARDAAHKRMYEAMQNGEQAPFSLENNVIYYLGPSPAKEGQVIGSAGPTTSSRMDKYTPLMLQNGVKGMIGKGKRSPEVIAYDDLGTEAIRKLEVENLPVVVVIDKDGNNLYETATKEFQCE